MSYKFPKSAPLLIKGLVASLALALCACTQAEERVTQTPEPAAAQPAELTQPKPAMATAQEPATFAIYAVYYTPDGDVIETTDTPLLLPDNVSFIQKKTGEGLYVLTPPIIDQDCLSHISALDPDDIMYHAPSISFQLTFECTETFHTFTKEIIGQSFAISFNGALTNTPKIYAPIASGGGFIEGGFTLEETRALASAFQKQINEAPAK